MIQLLFFLRFKTQLRRTRPEVVSLLEKTVVSIIESAGGAADTKHRVITGSFDEQSLGVWLTIITVLESILAAVETVAPELYGYTLVVGRDISDYEILPLCSTLTVKSSGAGIWCAPSTQLPLSPYSAIEEKLPSGLEAGGAGPPPEHALAEGYARLRINAGLAGKERVKALFPFREKILRLICYGAHRSAALVSPEFTGKRDGIYRFCAETLGDIPPLVLRFGARNGIGCFADLYTPRIRSLIADQGEAPAELDALAFYLFRERLMEEYSDYVIQKARSFFQKLLAAYISAVQRQKAIPVLVLEKLHYADKTGADLCLEALKNPPHKKDLLVYGTFSYQPYPEEGGGPPGAQPFDAASIEEKLQPWKGILPRTITFTPEECPAPQVPAMPQDLWEIACAVTVLGRYFPGFLFPQLFEEEEKKSSVLLRAFGILFDLGVIDRIEDPSPRIPRFAEAAEIKLGERKERIHAFARNRLLAWVMAGKLRPSFSLLEILADLGGKGGDKLILEAVYQDVINGTVKGIEKAAAERRFESVVGSDKSPALHYIFTTLKALIHGKEKDIREAFRKIPPKGGFFSCYTIQILANLTSYYLGIKQFDNALDTIKEAMLIGQNQKQGIAQVYRLFSLVNISKQQVGDSLDYMSFAVDNAEKSERFDELAVASYYAAEAQFLFGNLSKAEHLALKAEQTARASKRPGWLDRARFLRGKLRFEIGHYKDALSVFAALRKEPSGPLSEDMEASLAAWAYRTAVYAGAGDFSRASPAVPGPDGFLFEIEAAYMTGNYEKTLALTRRPLPAFPESDFLYTERPDWRSGFAQGELLLLSPKELWERMIFDYRCLALCRLPAFQEEREQVIKQMQRFTRDVLVPDTDPNDIFHFYVYYRILLESSASEIDRNTAISMAFRRLQRRANRIDDMETRRVFLNLHYWNSTLSAAAKEHKLI
ncbi:MAG: hypothetical protein LBD13_07165 [Spirochaetaceae bacterium]|jgi:tetratricopeptide (TPR) repeat protein|nr:hypothetical protein [Spirochaetaceae bacterium]